MEKIKHYSNAAIVIHWIMAILIIAMVLLGIYMADLPKGSEERSYFFGLHKSLGLTLALLAVIRLVWRLIHKPPPLPDYVGTMPRKLSATIHYLLYLMMFVQPISGYISSSFSGYKTKFWGIPLPHWGWKAPELNQLFTDIHQASAWCLIALIVLHLAGVFYHLNRKETDLFKRMWFGGQGVRVKRSNGSEKNGCFKHK